MPLNKNEIGDVGSKLASPASWPIAVSGKHRILCVALLLGLFLGVGVFDHSIWAPTEPTVAGMVWNMYRHGNLAVPMINDSPYFEKPPLYYWMAWSCCRLAHSLHSGFIRLPSALMGLAILALLYRLVQRRHGESFALLAVLFGGTSLSFYEISHRACTDMAALFLICGCFTVWLLPLLRSPPPARGVWRTDLALSLVLAFSFYAKNFYTYLVVLPPVLIWLFVHKAWGRAARLLCWVAGASLVLILPWAWRLFHEGGWNYLRIVFVDNTAGRFFHLMEAATGLGGPLNDAYAAEKQSSLFFYIVPILNLTVPWTLLFAASLFHLFRRRASRADGFRLFLQIAAIAIPVTLSLSSSKVAEYVYPVFFIFLLGLMEYLAGRIDSPQAAPRWEVYLMDASWILILLFALAAPVAGAVFWHSGWLLLGVVPGLLAVAWLVRHFRSPFDFRFLFGALAWLVLADIVAIAILFPWLDSQKTDRYFFDRVRPELHGRQLYTTLFDDRRLPVINYYLDQRILVDPQPRAVLKLLRENAPCGVFIPMEFYRAHAKNFAAIPHEMVYTDQGRGFFCFVATPREKQGPLPFRPPESADGPAAGAGPVP